MNAALDLDIDLPEITREIFLRDAGKLFRKQLYHGWRQYKRVGRSHHHHHHHHRVSLGQGAGPGNLEKSPTVVVRVAGGPTLNEPLVATKNTEGFIVDLGDLRPETLPQSKPLVEMFLQRKS